MSNRLYCGDRCPVTAVHDPMALCPPQTPVLEALENVVTATGREAFNTSPTDTAAAIGRV